MKKYFLAFSVLFFIQSLMAQNYYSKIFDFDQIEKFDRFKAMIEHDGYLYLLASVDYIDQNNQSRAATNVLKMDLEGNILNEQSFPWMVEQSNYGMNMLIENDFLYILNHYAIPFISDKNPINLLQLNLELDSIRILEYDPIVTNPWIAADASLTSFKDHFIATGWIQKLQSENDFTSFIMWINKNDLSLDTVYTFPSFVIEPDSVVRENMLYSFSNEEVSELYIFSELITRNPNELFNRNEIGFLKYTDRYDTNVVYLADTLGIYSTTNENTPFLTSTGNLFYEKQHWPLENAFVLMEPNGTILWEKLDIPLNPYGRRYIAKFMETADGNIVGCGRAHWHIEYGQTDPDTITHFQSAYLIKIDIETGDILWERFVIDYDDEGEVSGNYFANVVETDDGDLICAGYRYNNLANIGLLSSDSWIVRLDEYGCNPNFSCDDFSFLSSTKDVDDDNIVSSNLKVFPNPVSDLLYLDLPITYTSGRLIVRNNEGQVCMEQDVLSHSVKHTVDLSGFSSGIYFIKYTPHNGNGDRTYTAKVVVE